MTKLYKTYQRNNHIDKDNSKHLYNQIFTIISKYLDKDIPGDIKECLTIGPASKHPLTLGIFLVVIQELTGRSIQNILRIYSNMEDNELTTASKRWNNYINSLKGIQHDVAMVCTLVREKHCNNNKQYE